TTYYSYASHYAKVRNAAGTLVQAATPVVMPESVRRCRTATACSGSVNELVIDPVYNTTTSPNLLPVSITTKAGNGTLAATTSITYDNYGRAVEVDGPLS